MSQTSAPPSTPGFGPPISVPAKVVPSSGQNSTTARTATPGQVGRWSSTPGRMQVAAIVAVVSSLLFGLVGGWAYSQWSAAMEAARSDAAQLVRIQGIQNDLVRADAAASTAYLNGGTEPTAVPQVYDAAISAAAQALAQPVASSADSKVLETALDGLTRYTGLVERARANNRQGLQIGAAYQRQAHQVLSEQIVPALQQVATTDQQRVAEAYDRANRATATLLIAATLALVALIAVQVWLARKTHRIVNVPLAIASLTMIASLVFGLLVVSGAAATANRVARGSYAATVALAQARTDAFDAKSQEAFGLINRGNADADEQQAAAGIAAAQAQLKTVTDLGVSGSSTPASASETAFSAWVSQHQAVRAADDAGNWTQARDLAVTTSSTAFVSFADTSDQQLADLSAQVTGDLGDVHGALVVSAWLTLAAGLIAALASWVGVSRRLGEYR